MPTDQNWVQLLSRGPTTPAHPHDPNHGLRRRTAMVLVTVVALIERVLVIVSAHEPGVVPDEPGYWATARWLVGGTPSIQMGDLPLYQPVHGILLTPFEAFISDSVLRYRFGLIEAFVALVGSALLARHLVRKLGWGPVAGVVAYSMVLLSPAMVVTTSFTWSESTVLLVVFVFAVGIAHLCVDGGAANRWVLLAAGGAAGLAPFVHGRLTGLLPLWVLALMWAAMRRNPAISRLNPLFAGVLAGISGVCALAASALRTAIVSDLYGRGFSAAATVSATITDPAQWDDLLLAATGQLWYALVSSAGLAGIGVATMVASVIGVHRHRKVHQVAVIADPRRAFGVWILGAVVSVVVISASFMGALIAGTAGGSSRQFIPRWDHMIYGRYIDPLVVLCAMIGGCVLLERFSQSSTRVSATRRTRIQLSAVATTLVILSVIVAAAWADAGLADALMPNIAAIGALGVPSGLLGVLLATSIVVVLVTSITRCHDPEALLRWSLLVLIVWSFGGALSAMRFHSEFNFDPMYRDVPAADPDFPRFVVASDAQLAPVAEFNWPGTQMMLGGKGWVFDFSGSDSETLAGTLPAGSGLVALTGGTQPPEAAQWTEVGHAGTPGTRNSVTIWKREA
ncbi:MAG: hypothetical protein ACK5O2_04085 [Microthrixaceae bacterium]